jgi:hypothetical protein
MTFYRPLEGFLEGIRDSSDEIPLRGGVKILSASGIDDREFCVLSIE